MLNRYDPRSLEIAEEHITKALTRAADWKIPNNYAAVRRMQNTAVSLMQDDSEISQAIRQMTRSISGQPAAHSKEEGVQLLPVRKDPGRPCFRPHRRARGPSLRGENLVPPEAG